ncbi:NlpC/P60 family protein [Phenylobacterium sp.]|uniref:C40 family peptidase n=1 Tax=Phenylobacterium sp. TaxID=1871053 RepID=UPI0025E07B41|nr:NlpC/P60 family protein [Phenylobacterium sp.]MBX3482959.1 C40 family peptidase [Phenylobacterium sp.]MCW5759492.1 C40 family peptidase [Phenylobacterium sp.]
MKHDPRITPWRDGVAARSLEGMIEAEVYLDPKAMSCGVAAAAIRSAPDADAEQVDQLLFGERFAVIEEEGAWLWGQAARDGYVGFVEAAALKAADALPTHRVSALRTYAFAEASIKSRAGGPYSLGSLVAVEATESKLARVAGAGWMTAAHLSPVGEFEDDWAAVALRFVGAPYLWGGRESLGLDCSGLVQQALFACGRACPRDTDQQQALGAPVDAADFGRGDLVFWKGHVAMGVGDGLIVHANGHHMATVVEPLSEAIARIDAAGSGQPTAYRRV